MGLRSFLFINKNSSSQVLTRSENKDKSRLLSYVQARRRKREEGERQAEPWTKFTTCLTVHSRDPANEGRNRDPSSRVVHRRMSPQLTQVYPSGNSSDPFHATAAGIDASTYPMLQYTFTSAARMTFLTQAFAPPSIAAKRACMRHDNVIQERLRRCIEDETLMYSTLAYGSCCMAWMAGIFDPRQPPEYFIGKALKTVRDRLHLHRQLPNTWLLLSIYSLAITELWNAIPMIWTKCPQRYANVLGSDHRSLQGARTHLKALCTLAEAAGGWRNVEPYVLESALLADHVLALYEMTPPMMPLTWDPGPMSEERQKELLVRDDVFPSLGTHLLRTNMCNELRQIVLDAIDYVRIATAAWAVSTLVAASDESWLFQRLMSLMYRLALLENLRAVDDCIAITTLIFLLQSSQNRGAMLSASSLLIRLKTKLIKARYKEKTFDKKLLFWCLCTGAMTEGQPGSEAWFIGVLADPSHSLSPQLTKIDFPEYLGQYLFLPERQSTQLTRLMEKLSSCNDLRGLHAMQTDASIY